MPPDWAPPEGHEVLWHPAQKKGYSGVMTCSRAGLSEIGRGIDTKLDEIRDPDGRVLHTKHGNLHCVNMYFLTVHQVPNVRRTRTDGLRTC